MLQRKNASSFLAPIHKRTSFMDVRRTAFVKAFLQLFIRWQNTIRRNAEITEMWKEKRKKNTDLFRGRYLNGLNDNLNSTYTAIQRSKWTLEYEIKREMRQKGWRMHGFKGGWQRGKDLLNVWTRFYGDLIQWYFGRASSSRAVRLRVLAWYKSTEAQKIANVAWDA